MNSIVQKIQSYEFPPNLFVQEASVAESLWQTTAVIATLACFWVSVVFGKSYYVSVALENRRLREAAHLLKTYCSTAEGASLSKEFARCEEANVLISSQKLNRMRVVENTVHGVLNHELNFSTRAFFNVSLLCGVLFLFIHANKKAASKSLGCREVYSQIAQSRLHTALAIDHLKDD